MADVAFNITKGRTTELAWRVKNNDPSTSGFVLLALKTVEADATLIDRADLAAILANGSVEATNTGYARKVIDDTTIPTPTTDNTNDRSVISIPSQTWTAVQAAGGNWVALLLCYAPNTAGADSTFLPIAKHDFAMTIDGIDVIATIDANGVYRTT